MPVPPEPADHLAAHELQHNMQLGKPVPDLAAVTGNPLDERTLMVTESTVGIGRLQGVDDAGTLRGHPVVKIALTGKSSTVEDMSVDAFVDPATAAGLAQAITDALEALSVQGNDAAEGPVQPNRAERRRRQRGHS